jgi:hypothetical protein
MVWWQVLVVWPYLHHKISRMVFLEVRWSWHRSFDLLVLLSVPEDESCHEKTVAKSLPIASLIEPKIESPFLHLALGCECSTHALGEIFPRSPWRLWCIYAIPPFFGRSHCRPLFIHPSYVVIPPESVGAALRSIGLLVLARAP